MTLHIVKADKIARITLDRPPVNALTIGLYEELAELFESTKDWDDINCVILTAQGNRAFCAGLDLNEFLAASVEDDPARAAIVRRMFSAVRHAAMPVIAAVNGPALGAGAVLASVCDIRLASRNATFGLPEINVGRCGGGAHIGRLVPQSVLRMMAFTGQPIGADEALRVGMVNEVLEGDQLMARAQEIAEVIAAKAPLGLRLGKASLNEIEFMPVEDGYAKEQGYSTKLMATEDAREATRAVVEKRRPVFVGR
ncbi:enoyl-CoA hydratase-related protein [Sulfitobacter sp. F26204]|uniref:enoyl-CoA hydratase-related protein n=1 Tax=Sulfitobacter sp. F26204 TaxID=2996014 RepID=UPI00225DEFF8|nr:enoyl-CoA hydratase-related protein [Sulfitobacter sp. F26204]MCX7561348.1 enoyl-CoA hydratase-related protein [Sulfitobacter sp. F26204]